MHYDKDLLALQNDVARKKQLEAKLEELLAQSKEYKLRAIDLRTAYLTEQVDVQKLEGNSFGKFIYQIFGTLDEKLTKERVEAAAAKDKLDAAESQISAIDSEISEIRAQLEQLKNCEGIYANAFYHKRKALKESGTPAGEAILELEEKIAFLGSQKRELRQALSVGREAFNLAQSAINQLQKASSWNTADMLGGGLIVHVNKYQQLDNAHANMMALQGTLRRFKTELADINIRVDTKIVVDGSLRFADYFIDSFYIDLAIREQIKESSYPVIDVRRKVRKALEKLEKLEKEIDRQISDLKQQIENFVIHT